MSGTGKFVVSFEADPPPVYFSPEMEALEDRVRGILEAWVHADADDGLVQHGNSFILTTGFCSQGFNALIESLIAASNGAWLLVYGGCDGESSIMLELQNGHIVTQRERVPVDESNDYWAGDEFIVPSSEDDDDDDDDGIPY